ncbi:MAG: CHAT domain-containing protein [Cyanobacteriota bacterium]|nr:CHAT domain-containing protein [Cyanobacteriota bacterium]
MATATHLIPSPRSAGGRLVQQGQAYYHAGQFAQAALTWQQAVERFASGGNHLGRAIALSDLSLAYQELGDWSAASGTIGASLELLRNGNFDAESSDYLRALAMALNTQGRLFWATGQSEQAIYSWQQAGELYDRLEYDLGSWQAKINETQAMRALGLQFRALDMLENLADTLKEESDSQTKAAGLFVLGRALQTAGRFEESEVALKEGLTIAEELRWHEGASKILLSLGNLSWARRQDDLALDYYQQAADFDEFSLVRNQARLNQLRLLIFLDRFSEAGELLDRTEWGWEELVVSRSVVFARTNFANSLMSLVSKTQTQTESRQKASELLDLAARELAEAIAMSQELGDARGESYALGYLGKLYEQTQQDSSAIEVTRKALMLAQTIEAADIAYQWQWQLGRLLDRTGERRGAIAAYSEAIASLQSLRLDLVASTRDVQFSFQEDIEPIYRQLVDVLLRAAPGESISQEDLALARDTIEQLQLAELDNFFQDACLRPEPIQIEEIDRQAAAIYPIVLDKRLEVIVALPDVPLRHYSIAIDAAEVETLLAELRQKLVIRTSRSYQPLSEQVYDWLIRPMEADFARADVKTLVFVLDGPFRNVPMAALSDGDRFLIEKYGVALTPGLQLLESNPFQSTGFRVLLAALTQERDGFPPLPNVLEEVEAISAQVQTRVLLDADFTPEAIQDILDKVPFPVLHVATHGQFSSTLEDTFLLTWSARIGILALERLLKLNRPNPEVSAIELLVLSACQTAAGDKRAALGLAGIAVRAGARSTIASLWYIDDAATAPLMAQFYQSLGGDRATKVEALRQAQISLLKNRQYRHPIYWSPYVLVGNWL